MRTMMRRHTRRVAALLVLGAVALTLVLGSAAFAGQGAKKSGARFYGPNEYLTDWGVETASAGVGQLACTSSPFIEGNASFGLPLDVPDGARITKVTAYYYDADPDEHLTFVVGFHEPGLGDMLDGFSEVTSVDDLTPEGPPGGAQSAELIPTAPVPVDNANRRYYLGADFSACGTTFEGSEGEFPSLLLDGVRVEYALQ